MSDGNEVAIYTDANLRLSYTIKSGGSWGAPHALSGPYDQTHTAWTRDGDILYGLTGSESCSGQSTQLRKLVYAAGAVTATSALVTTAATGCKLLEYGIYFDHGNNLVHIWYEQEAVPTEQLAAYDTNLARLYSTSVAPTNTRCGDDSTAVGGDGGATFFLFSAPACFNLFDPQVQRVVAGASAYSVAQETGVATGSSYFDRAAIVWDGAHIVLVAKQDFAGVYVNTRTSQDVYTGWQNVGPPPDPVNDGLVTRITASLVGTSLYVGYSLYQTSTSGPDAGNPNRQHRSLYYIKRTASGWSAPTFVGGLDSNDYDPASGAVTDLNDLGTWRFVYHVEGQCASTCGYGPFLYEGYVSDAVPDFGSDKPWTYGPFSPGSISPDPVNLATGSYTSHADDLTIPGRLLGLSVTRWYNSADSTNGPLGPAWTHSFNWQISDAGSMITVRRGTGRRDTYARNPDGTYAPPPDAFDTLAKNPDGTYSFTLVSQVQYEFSTIGQLTRIHEPAGNQITLAYTAANLTTITDTGGRQVTFSYDASNRLIQLQDPLSRKVTYAYDASGRLTTVTDKIGNAAGQNPALHQWKYVYDGASQHISTVTDPENRVRVTNTYDGQGRVSQQRDALNALTTFAYGAGQTVLTDPRNHATTYTFDSRMRTLSQRDSVGASTYTLSYLYEAAGNRTSVTDRNGKTTDFAYDTRGNMLTKTDPQIDVQTPRYLTQFAYDSKNNLTQIIDPRGFVTAMTYDSTTNVLLSTSRQIDASTNAVAKYEYVDATNPGLPTKVIAPRGNSGPTPNYTYATTLTYDSRGNLTTRIDADAAKTTFVYDPVGRLTTFVDPDGYAAGANPLDHTWTVVYDENDRETRRTDPLGLVLTYGHDGTGNRTSLTDRRGNVTTYQYDANTRLASVQQKPDPIGQPSLVYISQITRDANGNATRITQANNAATDYGFDELNRLSSVTSHPDALTNLVTSYVLDGNGQPTTRTTADNVSVTYVFDAVSRLVSLAAPGLATITYTYDALGHRTQMTDATGTTSYQYDGLGRTTLVTAPNGTLTNVYDRDGNRTELGYPGNQTVSYAYSPGGRLNTVTDWASRVSTYTYQASGLVSTLQYPNGLRAGYAYDPAQRLTQLVNAVGTSTITSDAYTLDPEGNRTALDEFVSSITPPSQAWSSAERVNDQNGFNGMNRPGMALGADGAAYVVWQDTRAFSQTIPDIYFSRRDPVTGLWSANQRVNREIGTNAVQYGPPAIGVDSANNAYALWQDLRNSPSNNPKGDIYYAKRPGATGTWSPDLKVNDDRAGSASRGDPRIAVRPDGSAVAVWTDSRSNQQNIYSARLAAGASAWGANLRITSNTTATKTLPDVAIGPDGAAYAVWGDSRNGNSNLDIYYAKLPVGSSTWSANVKVSDDPGTAFQGSPRIGVDGAGNVLVIWYDSRTSPLEIRMSRLLAGSSTWEASRVVSDPAARPQGVDWPALGVRPNGTAFAAWLDNRGARPFAAPVYGSDYDPATVSWTASQVVTTTLGYGGPAASVSADRVAVVWANGDSGQPTEILYRQRTAGAGVDHFTYSYDGLNRLTSVAGTNPETFSFDAATNIAGRTGPSATNTYDTSNRQTSDGTKTFIWSSADRLIQRGSDTFAYDSLGRLTSSTVSAATRTFVYDGDGLLKSAATTNYLWDVAMAPNRLLQAGMDKIVYGLGPLYAVQNAGTTYTFARDGLGSVRAELTDAGAVAKSFRYAAYGAISQSFGGSPTLLGYAGELQDANGLIYLRARWYDVGTARFVTRDQLPGTAVLPTSMNSYGYALGNPGKNVDPSGLCTDPGGTGIRYCISAFIPQDSMLFFVGDNRGAMSNGGTYRFQQMITRSADGALQVNTTMGISRIGPLEREGEQGLCDGRGSAGTITVTCSGSDGLLFGFAPWVGYFLKIRESASGGSVQFVFASAWPSLEVWEYQDSGSPRLLFYNDASGRGIFNTGWQEFVVGSGK